MSPRSRQFIALLRGVNVGGHNKVPMAALRELCAGLGWNDVQTYIQSGNVVFSAGKKPASLESDLERAIDSEFGVSTSVVVRTADDWVGYVEDNPFGAASRKTPNLVMLALSKKPPRRGAVAELRERAAHQEKIDRIGANLWIYYPNGSARSKLTPSLLDRIAGSPVTTRNWRTVLKLNEMTGRG